VPQENVNKFNIKFGAPKHGWLPVELQLNSERFEFEASDVLNDPVNEIANAGVQLLSGSSCVTTNWWLEPSWHTLKLNTQTNNSSMTITFGYLADENHCNPESEHRITLDVRDFCRVVLRSLYSLRESVDVDEYASDSGWGKPFPDDKLESLHNLLAEPNGT